MDHPIWVVGLLAALLGLFVGPIGLVNLVRSLRARKWPRTRGQVVLSSLSENTKSRRGRVRTYYSPLVQYRYQVDGETYKNNIIAYGRRRTNDPRDAGAVCERYPQGREVDVSYNPAKPHKSVLEPGTIRTYTWVFCALGLWTLVAIPLIVANRMGA